MMTTNRKRLTFTPDDLMRFDTSNATARLREGLARAQAEGDADTIAAAETALLAHADRELGTESGTLTPERRAQALRVFGRPFGITD